MLTGDGAPSIPRSNGQVRSHLPDSTKLYNGVVTRDEIRVYRHRHRYRHASVATRNFPLTTQNIVVAFQMNRALVQ